MKTAWSSRWSGTGIGRRNVTVFGGSVRRRFCAGALAAALVMGAIACGEGGQVRPPRAVKGVLDCRDWDFAKRGAFDLDGEWEFHWKSLLAQGDSPVGAPVYLAVPGVWSGAVIGGRSVGCEGFATYRLTVRTGRAGGLFAVRVRELNSAYRLFVDGTELLSRGTVGKTAATMVPQNYPGYAVFRSAGDSFVIDVQVSNYDDMMCGIVRSVQMGTDAAIARSRDSSRVFDAFLFGSLLIMGIYHLGFFVMRKKDVPAVIFGAFCLVMAIRVSLTGERFVRTLFPDMPYQLALRLELLTLLGALLFTAFIRSLYPGEFNRRVIALFSAAGAFYGLLVTLSPIGIAIRSIVVFQIIMAMVALYSMTVMAVAVARRREGALIFLCGFTLLVAALFNDILHSRMVVQTMYLVPFGIFLFIFSQSFIIALRFSRSYTKVEDMTVTLAEYSDHLEEMVDGRTRELVVEKNKLARKNEILEKELDMARRIQQQLIPQHYPSPAICSLYYPMHLIGGDYYDFLQVEDPRSYGVFISDVSGHGVPAALVASMIKSVLLQAGGLRDDPAALLAHLNALLFGHIGENFVTAFYGVFTPASRSIVYSNAGHHPPFLVHDGSVRMLDRAKRVPLGVITAEEMGDLGKTYVNHRESLPAGSKIVLYTDGLVETLGDRDHGSMFGDEEIREVFRRIAMLPSQEFIENLLSSLMEFSGRSSFDDDVCVICIDL